LRGIVAYTWTKNKYHTKLL